MASLARITVLRTSRTFAPRAFSTSITARKSATEAVKNVAKAVDRKVSNKLVDGIEIGETATHKVKEVAGVTSSEVKGKASEVAGKASKVSGEAKGKASEIAGEAKGKANEVAGDVKGKL
ncbi:Uncharacterized protein BP5553_09022 [Venustampulla echinocandica]|uniref:Uncharacterized protein n=1 Tax=Venustampulla echinocandica TaxID=2656787 RepID=A0A370TDN2_9HELO|nr:Uncharacterized protein BP5553_09022 [Venustampulla echinocandica]RDL32566.1 Uncharacterized protein BP5553_09022 [Venustampulla echinocandica]